MFDVWDKENDGKSMIVLYATALFRLIRLQGKREGATSASLLPSKVRVEKQFHGTNPCEAQNTCGFYDICLICTSNPDYRGSARPLNRRIWSLRSECVKFSNRPLTAQYSVVSMANFRFASMAIRVRGWGSSYVKPIPWQMSAVSVSPCKRDYAR